MEITVVTRDGTRARFPCDAGEKLLHAGLRAGVALPYECATGTCGACRARLIEGAAASEWAGAPGERTFREAGELLTCQSVARGDCTLAVRALRGSDGAPAPQHLGGLVQRVTPLAPDVVSVELQLERALEFDAGQFALVSVPGIPGARAYSMVDAAPVTRRLTFVIKRKDGGAVSAWLWPDGAARVGLPVDVFAPLGGAVFRPGLARDVLCLAGGTGVAGMVSILRRAVDAGHFVERSGALIFGVRRARDAFLLDELGALRARAGPRLDVTVALSDEDIPEGLAADHPRLSFARGLVHDVAAPHVRSRAQARAWLAGPPPMVDASVRLLLTQGRLTPADIRFDKFT